MSVGLWVRVQSVLPGFFFLYFEVSGKRTRIPTEVPETGTSWVSMGLGIIGVLFMICNLIPYLLKNMELISSNISASALPQSI